MRMINSMEDKIEELIEWNIESLANMFGSTSNKLNNLQYTALDRIFGYDGITPFDKKSNALIDLEYKEMVETKMEAWGE